MINLNLIRRAGKIIYRIDFRDSLLMLPMSLSGTVIDIDAGNSKTLFAYAQ